MGIPAVVLIGLLAAAAITTLVLAHKRRALIEPRTRYPIVLVPGMFGFDEIGFGPVRRKYFHGIPEHLERLGVKVYRIRLPSTSSIAERAKTLAHELSLIPENRVNLIAHSMGGLDARYAISCLGCASRVASLTTIGTPHHGTPVADLGTALLDMLWLNLRAFADLTTSRTTTFNQQVKDVRSVRYASVVAAVEKSKHDMHALLGLSFGLLNKKAGPNDGIVPAESQVWGEVLARIDADHWAQIGWSSGFDAPGLYLRILQHLRKHNL